MFVVSSAQKPYIRRLFILGNTVFQMNGDLIPVNSVLLSILCCVFIPVCLFVSLFCLWIFCLSSMIFDCRLRYFFSDWFYGNQLACCCIRRLMENGCLFTNDNFDYFKKISHYELRCGIVECVWFFFCGLLYLLNNFLLSG